MATPRVNRNSRLGAQTIQTIEQPREELPPNTLDLTSDQCLFELAVEPGELLGHRGAKMIAELKGRALEAEFSHVCYRDPIRPGMIWLVALESENGLLLPIRAKLEHSRKVADRVFPGFVLELERDVSASSPDTIDQLVMSQIPPVAQGVSGLDLATALEYLVHRYPAMVRAWAALIFTYDQILNLRDGAEGARSTCISTCRYPQIVSYFLEGVASAEA